MTTIRRQYSRRALAALVVASGAASAFAAVPPVARQAFDPSAGSPAEGVVRSWDVVNVGDGSWSDAANWLPFGAPQPTDDVRLFQGDATNRTVTYDPASLSLNSLRIDATGNGQMTLSQAQGALVTNELVVGIFGKGQYNLSGGTLQGGTSYVGAINEGEFNQSGGRHVSGMFLSMGNNAGAKGTYNMSGGTLSASELDVGYFGTGSFNQQNGAITASVFYGVGVADTGVGSYLMTGGTLLAPEGYVGLYGTGSFTQGGGVQTVLGNLSLGEVDTGRGTYNMLFGTLNTSELNVGYEGRGTLNMSGGTVNAGTVFFGAITNARGTGLLSGGALNASSAAEIAAGTNSLATFTQNGGTFIVGGDLTIAYQAGSVGTYTLNGGAVSSDKLKVGYIGNATFTQVLGTNTVSTYLSIADQAASNSTYAMRGGTLGVGELEVGYRGTGSMFQDGGQVNVASFTAVGFVTTGRGEYNLLPGGTLNSPSTYVGLFGNGTFSQSGGVHNVPGVLSVGENTGSSGTYNFGGTGVINAGEVDVGFQGTGVFNQNGGQLNAAELNVAGSLGGVGSYNMTDGTLSSSEVTVAYTPGTVGTFSQSGGVHTATNGIHLAVFASTDATFTLNGGQVTTAALNVGGGSISAGGVALYRQNGGVMNVSGRVRVYGGNSLELNNGSFSSGTLVLNNGGAMRLGSGAEITPRVRAVQATSGTLNLRDNGLIVDYTGASPMGKPLGPFGSVANLIANGWNNGNWDGLGLNTSLGNGNIFALGYGEASSVLGISGSGTGTFRGETVDATSVLVVFTYYGDADLNRRVDIADFAQLGANFNTAGKVWQQGDFNYDETVGIGDFALMAANWNLAFPAGMPGARPGAVPEPATVGLVSLATAGLLRRRRQA